MADGTTAGLGLRGWSRWCGGRSLDRGLPGWAEPQERPRARRGRRS